MKHQLNFILAVSCAAAAKLPKELLLMQPSQTLITDNRTVFCIVFYWSGRGSPKEVLVYCTSLWRKPRKSLKRRNKLCDGSQQTSLWPQSASDASDWQKQPLLYSVSLVQIVRATDSVREVCTLASVHSAEEYSDPLSQISWSYLDVTKKQ